MFGCCVWWIFSNYSTVSRLLSANSHVEANLQKVIRVLVILRKQRTWFTDDESLKIAVKAWFESQNRKFYFQGINSWKQKLTICIDVAWEYVKNDSMCDIMLTSYSQVAKLFDHPLYMQTFRTSLQTDNHINTWSLIFYRPDAQPIVSKHMS